MSTKIEYDKLIKIGDRNGTLTIIETPYRTIKLNGNGYWQAKVKCDCGKEQNAFCAKWLRKEYDKCRSCQISRENNYKWDGYEDITGDTFYKIKHNAKRIGVDHNLSKKYLWDLFIQQNKKCALSGMDLKFRRCSHDDQTASLDRIDSSKGYVEGNVQWIHKDINKMKNEYDQQYYISVCKRVFEFYQYNGLPVK